MRFEDVIFLIGSLVFLFLLVIGIGTNDVLLFSALVGGAFCILGFTATIVVVAWLIDFLTIRKG